MNRRVFALIVFSILAVGAIDAVAGRGLERGVMQVRGHSYVESIDMLFDVRSGGSLSLGTTAGSVNVQTWSREQIRLVVTKQITAEDMDAARRILDMFSIRALHGGKNLKLEGRARTREAAAVGVQYTIWVPKSYNLDIKTKSGSIELPEVDGKFSARTDDGTITLDCDTEALDIEVEDRSGGAEPVSEEVDATDDTRRRNQGGDV